MHPKLSLRIAAILMLLHTIGHTIGALTWAMPPNPQVGQAITAMQTAQFEFMGRHTTLSAFYSGYGIVMIFVLLFFTILLWLLSNKPMKSLLLLTALFLTLLATSMDGLATTN